jgi:hypothetical protein
MPSRTFTSAVARAYRESARARLIGTSASGALFAGQQRGSTRLSLDPCGPTARRPLQAQQAWNSRYAAGWRA